MKVVDNSECSVNLLVCHGDTSESTLARAPKILTQNNRKSLKFYQKKRIENFVNIWFGAIRQFQLTCVKLFFLVPFVVPSSPTDFLGKRRTANHPCPVCGKHYVNEGSLRKHLACHPETSQLTTSLRMWPCSVCQAVFTHESGNLIIYT